MTRTSTVITSTTLGRSLRISGYPPEPLVDRHGKPVTGFHPVVVGFALDDDGDVMDRYRTLTPEQAREAAVALLKAADVAEGGLEAEPGIPVTAEPGSLAGRLLGLSEDEEDPS